MFAFGVLVLHLATAGAQPLVRLAPEPPPPPTATTGKPARKAPRPTFQGSTGKPPSAPRSKFLPWAKIKDLLPKPKTQAASWPRGVERPPHMQGPGRDPRYDNRGWGSDLRRKKKRKDEREAKAAAEAEAAAAEAEAAAAAAAAAEAEAQARTEAEAQAAEAQAQALAEVFAANPLAACIYAGGPDEWKMTPTQYAATQELLAMQEAHARSTEEHADIDTAWCPAQNAIAVEASRHSALENTLRGQHADEWDPLEVPGSASSSNSTTWRASQPYVKAFTTEARPWRGAPADPRPKPSSRAPTGCFKVACAGKAPKGSNPAQDGPPQALPEMAYPIVPRTGFYNVWN